MRRRAGDSRRWSWGRFELPQLLGHLERAEAVIQLIFEPLHLIGVCVAVYHSRLAGKPFHPVHLQLKEPLGSSNTGDPVGNLACQLLLDLKCIDVKYFLVFNLGPFHENVGLYLKYPSILDSLVKGHLLLTVFTV